MLEFKRITKIFDKDTDTETIILKDANFKINEGDKILISGENGIGKTSLLKIVGALDFNFSGEYLINGKNIKNISKKELYKIRNEFFGFLFQDYFLLEDENVYYNISIPLIYSKKFTNKEKKERIKILLKEFELENKSKSSVRNLSGGEKQKVAICRAIVNNPEVLILDEPTAALNPRFKEKFYKYIFDNIDNNTTVILVSHDTRYFDNSKFQKWVFKEHKINFF